jgi:hypothetical protein
MKRYLGKAVFEDVEVADSDFEDLTLLREDEKTEIEDAISTFEDDASSLEEDTSDTIVDLKRWRDSELESLSAQYDAYMAQYSFPYSYMEMELLNELYSDYLYDRDGINEEYNDEFERIIDDTDWDHYVIVKHKEREIRYIREETTSQIDEIIGARYFLAVYMIHNRPGACDYCISVNKLAATLSTLIKKRLIPPFHYHCRCFLSQVGYVVMSGKTPFVVSELLSEAAAEARVRPRSLIPTLPPPEPSSEEARKKWLAQVADWWNFWSTYYPVPTTPMYVLHG